PGGDQEAEGETGQSSQDQPGNGSEQGEQPGEQSAGEGQSQQDAGENSSSEGPPSDKESNASSSASGQPAGGGQNGEGSPPPAGETQPGDEANLDYARNQTDLILDKLDDQLKKKETDKKLLEKLVKTSCADLSIVGNISKSKPTAMPLRRLRSRSSMMRSEAWA
ncbi:MAG: hypothetical protein GXP28_05820, partial [Planctomycetes bacterium]|nr:hypothetical protein [Planctomycetota bacterium]